MQSTFRLNICPPLVEAVRHISDVSGDVTVISNAIARNVREGRSIVGSVTCGDPVQNENEEPEPVSDLQREPEVAVGPNIIDQINRGQRSLSLIITWLSRWLFGERI